MMRSVLALVAALLLSACGKGTYYPVPPSEARSALLASEIPVMLFGSQAGGTEAVIRRGDTVVWRVLDMDDNELLRLSAQVQPDGEGSRIVTDVLPPEGPNKARAEKGIAANPQIAGLYRTIANEQVNAVLNQRDFNMASITPAMMSAALVTMPQIQQQAMKAASEAQKQDRANIQRAYEADAHGWGSGGESGPDTKYGEPMDGSDE
ncbi:hypothetical protein [Novosphingobium cyanobacteriorum]|uniref:Lipoprotein n=1 Tax=Novosphingobium cyanobacteriorum TaxID=3024215 RepID=A0ABT6CG39_9SPHN|nr:hypothetical protein [Novosphingobium cyanobacteriorum]MDF8332055.1 hypothetical protein [Novosphingobium cyanobacteriorum]